MTKLLNPELYDALRKRFGQVKISSQGVPMKWHVKTDNFGKRSIEIEQGGEQYYVCCPLCGDTEFRLWIGHSWLTVPSKEFPRITHTIRCQRGQGCEVSKEAFYRQFIDAIGIPLAPLFYRPEPEVERKPPKMPIGVVPLDSLPPEHPANQFLLKQYNGLTSAFLSQQYGALFTDVFDPEQPAAQNRIIFPIMQDGKFAGWQGRAIGECKNKYIFNEDFRKCFYNADRVNEAQIPFVCEGITSSICCGPRGIALFGKDLDDTRCQEFARRWRTGVIVLDAETSIPDPRTGHGNRIFAQELKKKLDRYCRVPVYVLVWPEWILDIARKKFATGDKSLRVPDAADVGIAGMRELFNQIPPTHRGLA